MLDCRILRVLISSPGDCQDERDEMVNALHAWNVSHAERTNVYLWPWRWEENSYATHGHSGQATLNEQLVSKADICVAFFRHKLGTPTTDYVSGTAEEIARCAMRGLRPHVHFLDDGTRPPMDEERRLSDYKDTLKGDHYYMPYRSAIDGVRRAMAAVEADVDDVIRERLAAESNAASEPGSELIPVSTSGAVASQRPAPGAPYADSILQVAQRGSRRIVDMVSGMQGLVRHDWRAEVSDFENGWELTNTSGLLLELKRYRVVGEEPGTRMEGVWTKGVPDRVIRPMEPEVITDPDGRETPELKLARIRVEYVAEGVFLSGVVDLEEYAEVIDEDEVEAVSD